MVEPFSDFRRGSDFVRDVTYAILVEWSYVHMHMAYGGRTVSSFEGSLFSYALLVPGTTEPQMIVDPCRGART